jgi:hypothetical protein
MQPENSFPKLENIEMKKLLGLSRRFRRPSSFPWYKCRPWTFVSISEFKKSSVFIRVVKMSYNWPQQGNGQQPPYQYPYHPGWYGNAVQAGVGSGTGGQSIAGGVTGGNGGNQGGQTGGQQGNTGALGQDATQNQNADQGENEESEESADEDDDPGRELGVYIGEKQWWWYGASP